MADPAFLLGLARSRLALLDVQEAHDPGSTYAERAGLEERISRLLVDINENIPNQGRLDTDGYREGEEDHG